MRQEKGSTKVLWGKSTACAKCVLCAEHAHVQNTPCMQRTHVACGGSARSLEMLERVGRRLGQVEAEEFVKSLLGHSQCNEEPLGVLS